MRLVTCFLILAAATASGRLSKPARAQERAKPAALVHSLLPGHAHKLAEFVPKGWSVEARANGQLGDPLRRAHAFVLVEADQATPESEERILVVVFERRNGGYDLAAENHTFLAAVPPSDRQYFDGSLGMGQTMPPLRFNRGSLAIIIDQTFLAGPTADRVFTYSLRYRGGHLVLAGLDEWIVTQRRESVHNSYNYLSGKAVVFGGNCAGVAEVESGCRYKPTPKRIASTGSIFLEDMGSWLDFTPKVQ